MSDYILYVCIKIVCNIYLFLQNLLYRFGAALPFKVYLEVILVKAYFVSLCVHDSVCPLSHFNYLIEVQIIVIATTINKVSKTVNQMNLVQ